MKTFLCVGGFLVLFPAFLAAQYRLDDWSQPLQFSPNGIHPKPSSCKPGAIIEETDVNATGTGWKTTSFCHGALISQANYRNWLVDGAFFISFPTKQADVYGNPMYFATSVTGQFDLGKPVGQWKITGLDPLAHPPTLVSETLDVSGDAAWAIPNFGEFNTGYSSGLVRCADGGNFPYMEEGGLTNGLREGRWYNLDCNGVRTGWQGKYLHGRKDGLWQFYDPTFGDAVHPYPHQWETFVNDESDGAFLVNFPSVYGDRRPGLTMTGELKGGSILIALEKQRFDGDGEVSYGFVAPFSCTAPPDPKYGRMIGVWRFWGPNGVLYGESDLMNGSGRLRMFSPDGSLSAEGFVKSGLAEGEWKFYGSGNSGSPTGVAFRRLYSAGQPGKRVNEPGYPVHLH